MNPSHALFGLVVVAVPTAAIVFGLVAMGVIHFRKPPAPPRSPRKGTEGRMGGRKRDTSRQPPP
jgi:hypothetical protein